MKIVLLALGAAFGVAQQAECDVAKQTKEYFDTLVNDDTGDARKAYYSNDTKLIFDSELPIGGTYLANNVSLFAARVPLMIDKKGPVQSAILNSDEAMGTAMVFTQADVNFKRSGKDARMKLIHILEWDQEKCLLIEHQIIDQDLEATTNAYRTDAEKKLWGMLWKFYESSPEEAADPSSPAWDTVSDDIEVKFNMFPSDLISDTSFKGKPAVAKALKEMMDIKLNSPHFKKAMKNDIKHLKILSATDREVYASAHDGDCIVHYTFAPGPYGKLISEEMILAGPLQPWDVHPFPLPMKKDENDDDDSQSQSQYQQPQQPQMRRSPMATSQRPPVQMPQRSSQMMQPQPSSQMMRRTGMGQMPPPMMGRSQYGSPYMQQDAGEAFPLSGGNTIEPDNTGAHRTQPMYGRRNLLGRRLSYYDGGGGGHHGW